MGRDSFIQAVGGYKRLSGYEPEQGGGCHDNYISRFNAVTAEKTGKFAFVPFQLFINGSLISFFAVKIRW